MGTRGCCPEALLSKLCTNLSQALPTCFQHVENKEWKKSIGRIFGRFVFLHAGSLDSLKLWSVFEDMLPLENKQLQNIVEKALKAKEKERQSKKRKLESKETSKKRQKVGVDESANDVSEKAEKAEVKEKEVATSKAVAAENIKK